MNKVESFTHAGYQVNIYQDDDAQPPEQDGSAFLLTTDNRYFVKSMPGFTLDSVASGQHDSTHYRFNLHAYIHSGTVLSLTPFSCPWDSGQIGVVCVAKSEGDEQQALEIAGGLVADWNQYLTGDVYGYVVDCKADGEGSCWGFYGLDYCVAEAIIAAESIRAHEDTEAKKIDACMHL